MRSQIEEWLIEKSIPLYVPDYYCMYLIMIICGLILSTKLGAEEGYPVKRFVKTTCLVILSSIVGARFYSVIFLLIKSQDNPSLARIFENSGTGSFGAYVGGILSVIFISKFKKFHSLKLLDIYAPAMALSIFLGRLGCFMSGCCYGKVSHLPWAVSFPRQSLVFFKQQRQGLISIYDEHSLPVHPTQLYESLFGFVLFVFLLIIRKKKKEKGQLIFSFLLSYSLFRILIEFFRGDAQIFIGYFTLPQVLYFLLFLVSLLIFIHMKKKKCVCLALLLTLII